MANELVMAWIAQLHQDSQQSRLNDITQCSIDCFYLDCLYVKDACTDRHEFGSWYVWKSNSRYSTSRIHLNWRSLKRLAVLRLLHVWRYLKFTSENCTQSLFHPRSYLVKVAGQNVYIAVTEILVYICEQFHDSNKNLFIELEAWFHKIVPGGNICFMQLQFPGLSPGLNPTQHS